MTFWVAGAVVVGGAISANAAGDAADAQVGAASDATAEQRRQFDLLRADQQPYRDIGNNALAKLTELLNNGGLTSRFAGKVDQEPGYQFGMSEGLKGVGQSAAARGMGLSGEALKASSRYATDYATTKYNDAFNRWNVENNGIYNRLAGISGIGQTATNQVGAAGQAFGNAYADNTIGAGNAQAAAGMAQGNIYGNVFNQLGAMGYKGYFNNNNLSEFNSGTGPY